MSAHGRGWGGWETFFDAAYQDLNAPLFSEEQSREQVALALDLLGVPLGARVLDAACGWGRHLGLLAEAGFRAAGVDRSAELARQAARRIGARSGATVVRADLRALPFRDASFDAVLDLGTGPVVFLDDDAACAALRETRRVLALGATYMLLTLHRDDIVARFAARDQWRLPDGTKVRARRRFDPVSGISFESLRWERNGQSGRKRHALRVRTATEIDRLLHLAGFARVTYLDEAGRPFTHEAPSLLALAR